MKVELKGRHRPLNTIDPGGIFMYGDKTFMVTRAVKKSEILAINMRDGSQRYFEHGELVFHIPEATLVDGATLEDM